jgi:hypothetical protein
MFIASAPDFNIAVGNELKKLKYKIYIIEIHIKSGELYQTSNQRQVSVKSYFYILD